MQNGTTTVDLTLGLNAEIASIPLSLEAKKTGSGDDAVYTFDGCVQDADIDLSSFFLKVAEQFGVDASLPPELQLEIIIDYLVGQMILTKKTNTTEFDIAAQFEFLFNGDKLVWQFYAGHKSQPASSTLLQNANPEDNTKPFVVGFALLKEIAFSDLPVIGDIDGLKNIILHKIGFSYVNKSNVAFNIPFIDPSANPLYTGNDPQSKNQKIYTISNAGNQNLLNVSKEGFSLTVALEQKNADASQPPKLLSNFDLGMSLPAPAPGKPPGFDKAKTSPPAGPIHWLSINKTFGPVDLKQIGLNYSKGKLVLGFQLLFQLPVSRSASKGFPLLFHCHCRNRKQEKK